MPFRLQKGDHDIIEHLAEYRILSVSQLAAVFRKSKQVMRRRCRELKLRGVVKADNEFGQSFGRPERLFALTERGVDFLKDKGLIGKDVP